MNAGSPSPDGTSVPKDRTAALSEIADRYNSIFEQSTEIIFLVDLETRRLIDINPAFQRILGYTCEEALRLRVCDIIAHDEESIEANIKSAIRARQHFVGVRQYRCRDGSLVDVDVSAIITVHSRKEALCIMARDISAQKRAEADLMRQNALLKSIIESPRNVISFSLDSSYRYISFNDAHRRAMRSIWGADICSGMKILDVISRADDRDAARHSFDRALSGEQFVVSEQYGDAALGRRYWENTYSPIIDGYGKIIGLTVLCTDITDRKAAEEALLLEKSNIEKVTRSIGAGLVIVSRGYRIIWANEVLHSVFGDCRGRLCYDVYGGGFDICQGCGVREIFESGCERAVCDQSGKDVEGNTVWWQIIATPIRDRNGEVYAALELVIPITERKTYEELLIASLKEKEVLLKEVHHRVKNNLQVISSLLRLQSAYARNDPANEVLKESQNRIRSMAMVHEELYGAKDLAKIDLAAYTRKLTRYLLKSYGADRRIVLHLDAGEVSLGLDRAMPFGLMLNELITNCIKHAFPGDRTGRIEIGLHSDGDLTVLTVNDDGAGVPEGLDLQKPGSLGLALVHSLVKQLKGTMEIRSRGGTQVRIEFGY